MTAEIAILNKSAVALATDSAVTISAGSEAQKVFDTADKLFELSKINPIGVMIYNGMHFMGIPLQEAIKNFRKDRDQEYETVNDAADKFLAHLNELGKSAPESEKAKVILKIIDPVLRMIDQEYKDEVFRIFSSISEGDDLNIEKSLADKYEEILKRYSDRVEKIGTGEFFGSTSAPRFRAADVATIKAHVDQIFSESKDEIKVRIVDLAKRLVKSAHLSGGRTGIVFAGFGKQDLFPTLVSYEFDGTVAQRLKIKRTAECDIDRNGERAFVRPFAQKDMVDRFFYGIDDEIQQKILRFAKSTIGDISKAIFERLEVENDDALNDLIEKTRMAEEVFLDNLKNRAFKTIEISSRKEIEDMVEFMPKPELAKMAEALIDLTSMKRKVSRGLETVGGPVDVAVISKSDGFVWVKRKHYFPAELNARYFERMGFANSTNNGEANG